MFVAMEYVRLANTVCNQFGEYFDDIEEAKKSCITQSKCGGVIEEWTHDIGLCLTGTNSDLSSHVVYNKKGYKFFGQL